MGGTQAFRDHVHAVFMDNIFSNSTTAGILCALASGLSLGQAAAFGCLVASITVGKIGTTGTASPDELRSRLGGPS